MSSYQRIVITSPLTSTGFESVCPLSVGGRDAIQSIVNYFTSIPDQQAASLAIKVGTAFATGTLTVATGGSTAAQACTVCNVTLTGVAANPAANEFVVSATAATQATNMAAAINASASLSGKVTASASLGVVTITSVVPGLIGNALELSAGNLANVTAGAFANGSDGTGYSIDLS